MDVALLAPHIKEAEVDLHANDVTTSLRVIELGLAIDLPVPLPPPNSTTVGNVETLAITPHRVDALGHALGRITISPRSSHSQDENWT